MWWILVTRLYAHNAQHYKCDCDLRGRRAKLSISARISPHRGRFNISNLRKCIKRAYCLFAFIVQKPQTNMHHTCRRTNLFKPCGSQLRRNKGKDHGNPATCTILSVSQSTIDDVNKRWRGVIDDGGGIIARNSLPRVMRHDARRNAEFACAYIFWSQSLCQHQNACIYTKNGKALKKISTIVCCKSELLFTQTTQIPYCVGGNTMTTALLPNSLTKLY